MPAGEPLTGKDGTIKTGSGPTDLYQILRWQITRQATTSRFATNTSRGWKRTVAGSKQWQGTYEAVVDDVNAIPIAEGDTVSGQFHADSGNYYAGDFVVEQVELEDNIDEGTEIRYSVTFLGDGLLMGFGNSFAYDGSA